MTIPWQPDPNFWSEQPTYWYSQSWPNDIPSRQRVWFDVYFELVKQGKQKHEAKGYAKAALKEFDKQFCPKIEKE